MNKEIHYIYTTAKAICKYMPKIIEKMNQCDIMSVSEQEELAHSASGE